MGKFGKSKEEEEEEEELASDELARAVRKSSQTAWRRRGWN